MMKIVNSALECVAVKPAQYPNTEVKEIAFAGRSNVGKSSLLNMLTGRKSLARVSGNPGKTRTINFYLCEYIEEVASEETGELIKTHGKLRIVDLPGYGYAKVSKGESEKWGEMMESYLGKRDNLTKVIQLVDVRHKPSAQDVQMYDYLKYYNLDGIVVATKADKVSNNERQKCLKEIRTTLGMGKDDIIIPCSALNKTGCEKLLEVIAQNI